MALVSKFKTERISEKSFWVGLLMHLRYDKYGYGYRLLVKVSALLLPQ